ncbi:MAG: hypothetical protein WC614_01805 [bacterium]
MQILVILSSFLISKEPGKWNIEPYYYSSIKTNMSSISFPFNISSEFPLQKAGVKFLRAMFADEDKEHSFDEITTALFSCAPSLNFYFGNSRRSISNIYGYPAFTEVSLKVASIGLGFSFLIPCKGNLYLEIAEDPSFAVGTYDLRINIIRDGKEVNLYKGKQNSWIGFLDGIISLGYKLPFGVVLLSAEIEKGGINFPFVYNDPINNDSNHSTFDGIKIGLKIRRYAFTLW